LKRVPPIKSGVCVWECFFFFFFFFWLGLGSAGHDATPFLSLPSAARRAHACMALLTTSLPASHSPRIRIFFLGTAAAAATTGPAAGAAKVRAPRRVVNGRRGARACQVGGRGERERERVVSSV